MTESQKRYQEYLSSSEWAQVAVAVKQRAGYRCQVCNSQLDLCAHHRTYENRYNELNHLDDLICMCRRCHETFHKGGEVRIVERIIERVQVKEPAISRPVPQRPDVEVTPSNCHRLKSSKEMWHWYLGQGINPRKKGWAKRAIGFSVPAHFLR
jgi:hypothetical protein